MQITREIELKELRCLDCGRFFAVETAKPYDCPHCSAAKISRLVKTNEQLERSLRSAKAYIASKRKA